MQKEKTFSYIIQNLILIAIIMISSLFPNLTYFDEYTPFYEMTIIFFSGITYPRAISFTNLLIYGVLKDILLVHPIGISSLLFLSFKSLSDSQDSQMRTWTIYIKFALSLVIALIFQSIVLSIVFKYNLIGLLYAFVKRGILTVLLYPCFHLCYSVMMKFIDKKYYHVTDEF